MGSMDREIPEKLRFTVNSVKAIKENGFWFVWTYDYESWIDLLAKARAFIEDEIWITIPNHIRIGRKDIKHVFDHHWYDTEIWCWTSVTNEDIAKIQEIVYSYDDLANTSFEDNISWETHYRFTFRKFYWPVTYKLVVEVLQKRGRQPNQLWLITLYIADVVTEPIYLQMRNTNTIQKERENAKKLYWDRHFD